MAKTSQKANSLSPFFLHKQNNREATRSLEAQLEHRINLVRYWDITPGSRVLEIGCGQGDCTLVLADAVGEEGHIDAIDPGARPDYGGLILFSLYNSRIQS